MSTALMAWQLWVFWLLGCIVITHFQVPDCLVKVSDCPDITCSIAFNIFPQVSVFCCLTETTTHLTLEAKELRAVLSKFGLTSFLGWHPRLQMYIPVFTFIRPVCYIKAGSFHAKRHKWMLFSESRIDLAGVSLVVITDWRSQSTLLLIYRYISGEAPCAPRHAPDGNTAAGLQISVKLHQLYTLNYM